MIGSGNRARRQNIVAFDELERLRIERALEAFLAKRRPPPHIRRELDLAYRLSGRSVELFEIRPQWDDPGKIREHPLAKATYVRARKVWKVFWMRADLKWHGYLPVPTVTSIERFLEVVDADEHGCFFG